MRHPEHLSGVCDILSSSVTNGEVRVQLGDAVSGKGIGNDVAMWGVEGFMSRPVDPDPDAACQARYFVDGDTKWVGGTRDNRYMPLVSELQPGERMIWHRSGSFSRWHDDGSVTLGFTTDDGTINGNAIYARITPDGGFIYESPWARILAGPLGIHHMHSSGAEFHMSAIGGLPAPLDSFGSMIKLKAGIVSIEAGAVSIGNGTTPGLANELGVSALTSVLNAVVAALTTISATPAAVGSPVLQPAVAAALATLLATYATASTGIGKPI